MITSGSHPQDRERTCDQVIRQSGATFIPPSNDYVWKQRNRITIKIKIIVTN